VRAYIDKIEAKFEKKKKKNEKKSKNCLTIENTRKPVMTTCKSLTKGKFTYYGERTTELKCFCNISIA
ncbi:hypothetical protein, partial [Enterococcus faecalis]|uniref:hypothetical protein n=1 Tax=Enterococcus faecalis TaxID=1351 RepID=UPI003CC5D245